MSDRLDKIIGKLRAQQPELQDAEELTDLIMASLPEQQETVGRANPKAKLFLSVLRAITSAAAVLLIVLYVWQAQGGNAAQQQNDYEQCIARYRSDWRFDDCTDLRAAGMQYARMRTSRKSITNRIKKDYHEDR